MSGLQHVVLLLCSQLLDVSPHAVKLGLASTDQVPNLGDVANVLVSLKLSPSVPEGLSPMLFRNAKQFTNDSTI